MGPLVGLGQRRDVLAQVAKLRSEADIVVGDPDNFAVEGADRERGAFIPPIGAPLPTTRSAPPRAQRRGLRSGLHGDGL